MAGPASSSMFKRLTNAFRLLSLRSDIDDIILELLGQFSLEKIYAEADGEKYQTLVATLLAQLNTIFGVQRLSLPSENQQLGWYLGFLASWEVTLRTIEYVLQVVFDGRECLWEARLLRDKYLPELLLNALRFVTLHPKIPSSQRPKDRRDRFSRIQRSLGRIFDSYPGPESFLLLVCKEVIDTLRVEPSGLTLPPRMRSELPNLASELYPLSDCLSSQYVSSLVPLDGFPGDWLSQFLALRDISQFVVGASVQYIVNQETRDMRLQASSARTRNAVLRALENIRLPSHLSQFDMLATFSDTFRIILPDTINIGRRDSAGSHVDENEIDAIDALCMRLTDRQIVHRVSDREVMHSISQITRNLELLDDPSGQFRASRPKIFAVNCQHCHFIGETQLKTSDSFNVLLEIREAMEICLPLKSKCIVCAEPVTMMREISFGRNIWDLLKPLESNADTINVERHLPTQFQLSPPKADNGPPSYPGFGSFSGRHNSANSEPSSPPPARTCFQSGTLMSPVPSVSDQKVSTPRTEFAPSEELTSSDTATYFNNSGLHDIQQVSSTATTLQNSGIVRAASQPRMNSVSTTSFPDPSTRNRSRSISVVPHAEKISTKSKWRSKLTSSKREPSKSSGESSEYLNSLDYSQSQKLEEVSLQSLVSASKVSMGKKGKIINVTLSQNSSYALFWTQSSINIWDISTSSPILGRAILTESNCILAAVTKVYLAYIIRTLDHKLTLKIVNLLQSSQPTIEYRMPASPWCHSICILPKEEQVVVGFDNSTIRLFNTSTSEEPREIRLHLRNHRDCKACPSVDSLSFSNDGSVLLASTRSLKSGVIQIYSCNVPFEEFQEITACRYRVPLHESEDNGVSSAIFRSGATGEENLICITTWTQSGIPILVQPLDGHRIEVRTDPGSHQGKLGSRIQCAAFSPTGGELAMVNDKGHLYHISNLNSTPMEVRRIATSKELTTKSIAFSMVFMTLPDEEAIVLAWADSSKGLGFIKKIPVKYNDSPNTPVPITPLTPAPLHLTPRFELPSEGREIPRPPVELNVTEIPAPLNIVKGTSKD